MKHLLSAKDKEICFVENQKQEEKERAAKQIAKLNEVVEQLKLELNQMREHLADNEEYTTRLEDKMKRRNLEKSIDKNITSMQNTIKSTASTVDQCQQTENKIDEKYHNMEKTILKKEEQILQL